MLPEVQFHLLWQTNGFWNRLISYETSRKYLSKKAWRLLDISPVYSNWTAFSNCQFTQTDFHKGSFSAAAVSYNAVLMWLRYKSSSDLSCGPCEVPFCIILLSSALAINLILARAFTIPLTPLTHLVADSCLFSWNDTLLGSWLRCSTKPSKWWRYISSPYDKNVATTTQIQANTHLLLFPLLWVFGKGKLLGRSGREGCLPFFPARYFSLATQDCKWGGTGALWVCLAHWDGAQNYA